MKVRGARCNAEIGLLLQCRGHARKQAPIAPWCGRADLILRTARAVAMLPCTTCLIFHL